MLFYMPPPPPPPPNTAFSAACIVVSPRSVVSQRSNAAHAFMSRADIPYNYVWESEFTLNVKKYSCVRTVFTHEHTKPTWTRNWKSLSLYS